MLRAARLVVRRLAVGSVSAVGSAPLLTASASTFERRRGLATAVVPATSASPAGSVGAALAVLRVRDAGFAGSPADTTGSEAPPDAARPRPAVPARDREAGFAAAATGSAADPGVDATSEGSGRGGRPEAGRADREDPASWARSIASISGGTSLHGSLLDGRGPDRS